MTRAVAEDSLRNKQCFQFRMSEWDFAHLPPIAKAVRILWKLAEGCGYRTEALKLKESPRERLRAIYSSSLSG